MPSSGLAEPKTTMRRLPQSDDVAHTAPWSIAVALAEKD